MKKEKKINHSLQKLLLDKIDNKYQFIIQVSSYIKKLEKKLGKEKTKEEILEQAVNELILKGKTDKKAGGDS